MPLFNNGYDWWNNPQLNQQGLGAMLMQQVGVPQEIVPQQPLYGEVRMPVLDNMILDPYGNYSNEPLASYKRWENQNRATSPLHPIHSEEPQQPKQTEMTGIEPYDIGKDPMFANVPSPPVQTPDPYQTGLSPQDQKNSLIQALLGFGFGTLAANKPGTTGGQAIGAGGLTGLQQYGTATQSALKQNLEKYQAQKLAEQMALSQQQETRKNLIESANLGLAMKKDLREEKALQPALDEKVANTEAKTATTQNLTTPIGEANAAYASKQLGYTVDPQMTYDQANKLGIKFTPEKPEKNAIKVVVDKTSPTGYSYQDLLSGQTYPNAPAPQAGTTVNVNTGGKEAWKGLGEGLAKDFVKRKEDAGSALKSLDTVKTGRELLESGVITGTGANIRLEFGRALATIGVADPNKNDVANTDAYIANMGKQVGEVIRLFGSGTGLSDADRQYAEKIAGGKITATKESLSKILDINEKAARNVIRNYNKEASKIKNSPNAAELPFDITIEEPPLFTKPQKVTSSGNRFTVKEIK